MIAAVIGGEPSVPSGGFPDTMSGKPHQRSMIANGREFVVLRLAAILRGGMDVWWMQSRVGLVTAEELK